MAEVENYLHHHCSENQGLRCGTWDQPGFQNFPKFKKSWIRYLSFKPKPVVSKELEKGAKGSDSLYAAHKGDLFWSRTKLSTVLK